MRSRWATAGAMTCMMCAIYDRLFAPAPVALILRASPVVPSFVSTRPPARDGTASGVDGAADARLQQASRGREGERGRGSVSRCVGARGSLSLPVPGCLTRGVAKISRAATRDPWFGLAARASRGRGTTRRGRSSDYRDRMGTAVH